MTAQLSMKAVLPLAKSLVTVSCQSNDTSPINCILTHWGRVTHICVGNLTIIGSDNGLSPGRRQAIIWTNDGKLLIGPLGNFNRNLNIFIQENAFENVVWKMSAVLSWPQCVKWKCLHTLNVLKFALIDMPASSFLWDPVLTALSYYATLHYIPLVARKY